MKLTMGNSAKSLDAAGTVVTHFGFKFTVQEDGLLVTDEIPKALMKVAAVEIKAGRLLEHKSAQQEAEEAAAIANAAAKKAAKASRRAAKDAKTAKAANHTDKAK
jgi:hypothetical protein